MARSVPIRNLEVRICTYVAPTACELPSSDVSIEAYRFYANNAQCHSIFLAVCHDNGYVASLDHYKQDISIACKTILVKHQNTAAQYQTLQQFRRADLGHIFEAMPERTVRSTPGKFRAPSPMVSFLFLSVCGSQYICSSRCSWARSKCVLHVEIGVQGGIWIPSHC